MELPILVIDDEPSIRNLLSLVLKQCGYAVETSSTINEANIQMEKTSYRGIIIDYLLPDEDGISFIRKVRHNGISVPVILLSGMDIYEIKKCSSDITCICFLSKPFDVFDLIDIAHHHLASAPVQEDCNTLPKPVVEPIADNHARAGHS